MAERKGVAGLGAIVILAMLATVALGLTGETSRPNGKLIAFASDDVSYDVFPDWDPKP